MTDTIVLAVDGGNSKTHLAVVGSDGAVHALVRGPMSSPHHLGLDGSIAALEHMLEAALAQAQLPPARPHAAVAQLLMAGVDFPSEEQELREAIEARGWAQRTIVGNDTFAVLRAGTERGWGVAVTCGSGINCVGVAPDGRHARFPSLGTITGDWGGGYDVGLAAVFAAARSEDGRGPRTTLEHAVPAHFGLETPHELAEAIHRSLVPLRRVQELPPVVFAEATDDPVARSIVEHLADEVVALARVALERLELQDEPVEVLLGGGLLQSGDGILLAAVEDGLRSVSSAVVTRKPWSPPIVGAALLALDELGAGADARERVREELRTAVEQREKVSASG